MSTIPKHLRTYKVQTHLMFQYFSGTIYCTMKYLMTNISPGDRCYVKHFSCV